MKKVLIIDLCSLPLHFREFVKPVLNIVEKQNLEYEIHNLFNLNISPNKFDYIIICGTALKDFKYLNYLEKISWISTFEKPVLGICAGAQILGLIHNSKIIDEKKIGLKKINIANNDQIINSLDYVYCLYSKTLQLSKNCYSISTHDSPLFFKHKTLPHYGTLFHPEVRNQELILTFLNIEK